MRGSYSLHLHLHLVLSKFQKICYTYLLGLDWQIQAITAVGFANPTGAVLVKNFSETCLTRNCIKNVFDLFPSNLIEGFQYLTHSYHNELWYCLNNLLGENGRRITKISQPF